MASPAGRPDSRAPPPMLRTGRIASRRPGQATKLFHPAPREFANGLQDCLEGGAGVMSIPDRPCALSQLEGACTGWSAMLGQGRPGWTTGLSFEGGPRGDESSPRARVRVAGFGPAEWQTAESRIASACDTNRDACSLTAPGRTATPQFEESGWLPDIRSGRAHRCAALRAPLQAKPTLFRNPPA